MLRAVLLAGLILGATFEVPGLPQGGTVNGRITDRFGCPLPGALVTVRGLDGRERQTISGSTGDYRSQSLSTGPASLQVTLRGFQRMERSLSVRAGVNTVDVALPLGWAEEPPALVAEVSVTDNARVPLSDARVNVMSALDGTLIAQSRTGRTGRAVLRLDDGGDFIVLARATGFEAVASVVTLPQVTPEIISLVLTKPSRCGAPPAR